MPFFISSSRFLLYIKGILANFYAVVLKVPSVLGHFNLIFCFSGLTNPILKPTDPILKHKSPEKHKIKLKWPY